MDVLFAVLDLHDLGTTVLMDIEGDVQFGSGLENTGGPLCNTSSYTKKQQ